MGTKQQHFRYWLRKYVASFFFPRLFLEPGFRRDWMTWKQYKKMTDNLTKNIEIKD